MHSFGTCSRISYVLSYLLFSIWPLSTCLMLMKLPPCSHFLQGSLSSLSLLTQLLCFLGHTPHLGHSHFGPFYHLQFSGESLRCHILILAIIFLLLHHQKKQSMSLLIISTGETRSITEHNVVEDRVQNSCLFHLPAMTVDQLLNLFEPWFPLIIGIRKGCHEDQTGWHLKLCLKILKRC